MTQLSGLVAILNDAGEVTELRDLGPEPVPCKPGRVLPVEDVKPGGEDDDLSPPALADLSVLKTKVVRTWVVTRTAHQKAVEAIQARRERAILEFEFMGHRVPLTPQTRGDIGDAYESLKRKPDGATIKWEIVDGVYIDMDLAGLEAFGDAGFDYIQACYARSEELTAAAVAGEPFEIDSGWPS